MELLSNHPSTTITVVELAAELGIDRSNCLKWLKRNKIPMVQVRRKSSNNQLMCALTEDTATYARSLRRSQGFE